MKTKGATGLKAVLVAAASLTAMGLATHASADQTIYLQNLSMNENYEASIAGFGAAYSNIMTFAVSTTPNGPTTNISGFCVDIFHEITTGALPNYAYNSTYGNTTNALTHNFDYEPPTYPASDPLGKDTKLSTTQIKAITDLVDTGWILNQEAAPDAALQDAAIQAAIWEIENPGAVSLIDTGRSDFGAYEAAYANYVAGTYTDLTTSSDLIYMITDENSDPAHQSFAIGWPNAIPEPATWALMLTGFFGVGGMLRRRQAAAAA